MGVARPLLARKTENPRSSAGWVHDELVPNIVQYFTLLFESENDEAAQRGPLNTRPVDDGRWRIIRLMNIHLIEMSFGALIIYCHSGLDVYDGF